MRNLLFSLTNLSLGGAQMFVLNLAGSFAKDEKFNVFIYDHNPEYSSKSLYDFCDSRVKIINYSNNKIIRFFILKINGFIKRLGIKFNFRDWYNTKIFLKTLNKENIHVVNSQMSQSDFLCGKLVDSSKKLVITLHGEFELYLNQNVASINSKIDELLNRMPEIVYTADKNYNAISEKLLNTEINARKIYIGINPEAFSVKAIKRSQVFGSDNVFVLGMISRGIPEKGWEFLIEVFNLIEIENIDLRLLLISDSKYVEDLVKKEKNKNIVFMQFENNYQDYFSFYQIIDLFVFPTFFKGESVPTVVAECMYWNIPVVANNHAEIKNMISFNDSLAGDLINFADKEFMLRSYVQLISKYITDANFFLQKKSICKNAYLKFDIDSIRSSYEKIFLN